MTPTEQNHEPTRDGLQGNSAQAPSEPPRLLLSYPVATKGLSANGKNPPRAEPVAAALAQQGESLGFLVKLLPLPLERAEATHWALLHEEIHQALRHGPVALGGFSLGARLVAQLSPLYPIAALALWGYPFHAFGRPQLRTGLDSLLTVRAPCLILQGARDPHGNQQAVRGYGPLPRGVSVRWINAAKHRIADPRMQRQVAQQLAHFIASFLVG